MCQFLGFKIIHTGEMSYAKKGLITSLIALFCNGHFHGNYIFFSSLEGKRHYDHLIYGFTYQEPDDIPF
jgi:hypothetical protein